MEVWRGSKQATTKEWGDDDAKSTIPGSIPEAAVQIGDIKPVEVVFLASPEEFCVQVRAVLLKYCILLSHTAVLLNLLM
jgi:hypothetical protein